MEDGTLLREKVFQISASRAATSDFWEAVYRASDWFGTIYELLSSLDLIPSDSGSFSKAMSYRIHELSHRCGRNSMKAPEAGLLIMCFSIESFERTQESS